MKLTITIRILLCISALIRSCQSYEPTWESLETRPLPSWYDQSKVGIFVHWGVFSVPAFAGYKDFGSHYAAWFWNDWHYGSTEHLEFMNKHYPSTFTYHDFASLFKAEFFDPYAWAELFNKSGAKYVVLTSKHHEGYSLYPSKYSFGWNSMDLGPNRDLVGDLARAVRETTELKFGLYHSRFEWFNPLFQSDKANQFHTDDFVRFKTLPELYELVELYRPEVVWSDGEFDAHSDYWQAKEFLAWLYNESPVKDTVVSNDRWGNETVCKLGGFLTCTDHYNPGVIQERKWENCMTLDKHAFSFRRNARLEDYLSPEELIQVLIETVSCGGNLLVNVGPTADGMIVPVQEERLLQLGQWLEVNGEAIYESTPWTTQNDTTPGVWYTTNESKKHIYALILDWPTGNAIQLSSVDPGSVQSLRMFGTDETLSWAPTTPNAGITVSLPARETVQSKWAWTLAITQL